jgi:hypothetical protein
VGATVGTGVMLSEIASTIVVGVVVGAEVVVGVADGT